MQVCDNIILITVNTQLNTDLNLICNLTAKLGMYVYTSRIYVCVYLGACLSAMRSSISAHTVKREDVMVQAAVRPRRVSTSVPG